MPTRGIKNAQIRRLLDEVIEHGWSVRYDGQTHITATSPDLTTRIVVSTTANDAGRNYKNTRAPYLRWLRQQKGDNE